MRIQDNVDFNGATFNNEAKFMECEFQNDVDFDGVIFKKQVSFIETRFKSIDFEGVTFNNEIEFKNCEFQNGVKFRKRFENSIYFDDTTFNDYADFSKCVFEKIASFCGATFKKPPNFFQAKFNGSLNLVNTKLEFDYEQTKEIIKKQNDDDKKTEKQKTLDETANEFRDSFRLLKNALIKDGNLLDASNFHKLELYCKEIELDSKLELGESKRFSRDWIDKIILTFYRFTSDHHTDFLKSFHSLLLVIGIFGFLSGIMIAWLGFAMFCGDTSNMNLHTLKGFCDLIGFYGLMEFYDSNIKSFISNNSLCIFILNFLIPLVLLALVFIIIILFVFIVLYGFKKSQCSFKKACHYASVTLSYITTCLILFISPKYIIPAINIFTDKRSILDPLSVIGAVYTILFALMLYSFIKTARKNSIVPS